MSAIRFILWAGLLGVLLRRWSYGPQKKFALTSFSLLWVGEAFFNLASLSPIFEGVGYFFEMLGFTTASTMFFYYYKWKFDQIKTVKDYVKERENGNE